MNRLKENQYDYSQDIQESINTTIFSPKSSKIRLIKQLNFKCNLNKSEPGNITNSSLNKIPGSLIQMPRIRQKLNTKAKSKNINQFIQPVERNIPGGRLIVGDWIQNKLSGYVVIQYDNGSNFQGQFQNGVKISGKMIYPENKCEYEGGFFGEKFDGYGKLTYYEGRTIQGEWDNLQLNGNVTITYPNKDVYYGPVDENIYKHGQGYLFLSDGYKYIGFFKHGSITGLGIYCHEDDIVTRGYWDNGKLIKYLNGEQFDNIEISSGKKTYNQNHSIMKAKQKQKQRQNIKQQNQSENYSKSSLALLTQTNSSQEPTIVGINHSGKKVFGLIQKVKKIKNSKPLKILKNKEDQTQNSQQNSFY